MRLAGPGRLELGAEGDDQQHRKTADPLDREDRAVRARLDQSDERPQILPVPSRSESVGCPELALTGGPGCPQAVQLLRVDRLCSQWSQLPPAARVIFIDLCKRHNGKNNVATGYGCRDGARAANISPR
jgi:hypothetical protein